MATLDEIFASMPEPAAEGAHEYLVIDPETRTIFVPDSEMLFGVTGDEIAERKYFKCPRYVGDGLDLASMFLRVNWRNAKGDEDGYLVEDLAVSGDNITFSWPIDDEVVKYQGTIQFGVCADLPSTPGRKMPDWNTTMAAGRVLEGPHTDDGDVEGETSNVVTQLREMVTRQTAAVEATGAAQVDVVEAAGAAATADAQAQIEAKGAATLATIPADYTTLANKTNEQANAIKGQLAGEIVQAGDVSPVEHYLAVKVHGKNRYFSAADYTGTLNGIAYTTAQNSAEVLLDGTASEESAWTNTNTLTLPAGTYTVSVNGLNAGTASGDDRLFIRNVDTGEVVINHVIAGTSRSFVLKTVAAIRVYLVLKAGSTYAATTVSIQIEDGDVATEYTPYIDPAGVTVTRCGKNLLPFPYASAEQTYNGVTFTPNEDGSVTVNGTATGDGISFMLVNTGPGGRRHLPAGTYFLSCPELATADLYMSIFFYDDNETTEFNGTGGKNKAFTLDKSQYYGVYFRIYGGVTVTNLTLHPQLELGDTATEYEPYNGATAMPDAAGTVTGLPSLAPNMTLLTDTPGVKIECTYNRDSNAVLAEVLAKIAALSGTN